MAGGIAPSGRAGRAAQAAVQAELGNRRGIGVGAFVLALVTAGAMAHVAVRMKGIEVAYELGHERRINTQLEEERRRLHIEIGMLKDPVRVVGIARDKLQMGPPAQADIVRLVPGQVLGARPEAPPATSKRAGSAPAKPVTKVAPAAAKAAPHAAPTRGAPARPAVNVDAPPEDPPAAESAPAQEADE
jgi:cell division protein FtsL